MNSSSTDRKGRFRVHLYPAVKCYERLFLLLGYATWKADSRQSYVVHHTFWYSGHPPLLNSQRLGTWQALISFSAWDNSSAWQSYGTSTVTSDLLCCLRHTLELLFDTVPPAQFLSPCNWFSQNALVYISIHWARFEFTFSTPFVSTWLVTKPVC